MSIFDKIGQFFAGLFNAAKKTWNKLDPKVQDAILHGSAVVDAINSNLDKTPEAIINFLQMKFPDLTLEKLKHGLQEVSKGLNIISDIEDPDLETMIKNLQDYLSKHDGKVWAGISHTIASIFAIVVAPPTTKFAAVASLIEWAYQNLIKKDK